MQAMRPARWLWVWVGSLLALGFAALLLVSPAAAQTETAMDEPRADETPATAVSTEGSGGIVPSTPEPTATEPGKGEEEVPVTPEGQQPTETPDNEGVAPAVVVVVVWTADGGPTSDRTLVCVSEICQPVGAVGSGSKIEFERIVQGWHEVSVTDAGAYANGFGSVAVRPGQRATVEVTLARLELEVSTPPPVANGPIRQPIDPVPVVGGDGDAAGGAVSAQFAGSANDGDEAALRVVSLPATGVGSGSDRSTGELLLIGGTLLLALALGAVATRRKAA